MRLSRRMVARIFPYLLVLVTVAAYWPVMRAGYIWDDDDYLTKNPVYTAANPLHKIWLEPGATPQYYPVVFTAFYLERGVWGLNPARFHAVNVGLHAGSAILLWLVLRRLKVPGAMLAAAIFAVHPVMVESVAWVTERKNTFSLFFFLGALLAYLAFALNGRAEEMEGNTRRGRRAWLYYAVSLALFVLAMLSKTVACGLAPVLVLILWWKRPGRSREMVWTIPFFAIGLAGGLTTAYLEVTHVGAQGAEWTLGVPEKFLLASQAVWFYVYKLLFPAKLSFYYTRWEIDRGTWWQWLFPAMVGGAFAGLWALRRRIGRGPSVAATAFVALLFPALGFFSFFPMLFSWVADHFSYHATVAFLPAICAALTLFARRVLPGRPEMRVAISLPLLMLLGTKTYLTTYNYENPGTLWRSVIEYSPEHPHWNALSGLSGYLKVQAQALLEMGRRDEAMALNEEARALDEKSLEMRPNYAVAYNNLAGYHAFKGEFNQALPWALKAVEADPGDPRIRLELGYIYSQLGQLDKSVDEYVKAVFLKRTVPAYHLSAAKALMDAGKNDRAATYIANALYMEPGNPTAHLLRGFLLAQKGEIANAVEEFRYASRADPTNADAANNYAKAVAVLHTASRADLAEAERALLGALDKARGTNFELVDTYAILLHRTGRNDEALRLLRDGLSRVPPDQAAAKQNMIRNLAIFEGAATMPTTRGR